MILERPMCENFVERKLVWALYIAEDDSVHESEKETWLWRNLLWETQTLHCHHKENDS